MTSCPVRHVKSRLCLRAPPAATITGVTCLPSASAHVRRARRSSPPCARAARCTGRGRSAPETRARLRRVRRALRAARRRRRRTPASSCFARGDDALVGVFNFSEIVRGAFRSAYLGYFGFAPHAGQGLHDRRAWRSRSTSPSRKLKLHRVEVNIQPTNARSLALATRIGLHARGLLAPLREDRRPLARPRALRDAGRGLARAAPKASLRAQGHLTDAAARPCASRVLRVRARPRALRMREPSRSGPERRAK